MKLATIRLAGMGVILGRLAVDQGHEVIGGEPSDNNLSGRGRGSVALLSKQVAGHPVQGEGQGMERP